jgi:ribosomal protein S27E
MKHDWIPSTLGHGETMCSRCFVTNREAEAIGMIECDAEGISMNDFDNALLEPLNRGHCPDCNHRGFVLGPRGGAAQNIECGGCGNRFNVTLSPIGPPGAIVLAHRIESERDGGSTWLNRRRLLD